MSEQFRLRIVYAKQDRLRWLSHLEVMRAMERLVRRSGLPYVVTQGFNRHMRFAIGPALPVGTAGLNELFDVWLTQYVAPSDAQTALSQAADDIIAIRKVQYVNPDAKGLQATHTINRYLLLVDSAVGALELQSAMDAVIATGHLELPHKKSTRSFDLSQTVAESPVVLPTVDADGYLLVSCAIVSSDTGSLRPEQLLACALDEGSRIVSVTRTALESPDTV
ncbi:MAG: TIGR03936 family radical SAM-associated protein [Coriobacteriia bacterium]|nr:TIGR03936 family radical SAM-associated protein [Coriobacteriia bacterium]